MTMMRSNRSHPWLLACLLSLLTSTLSLADNGSASDGASAQEVVVVELFTSQGCSSCPPADRLLSRLSDTGKLDGTRLIPLAYHVDYWNYIGWTDPFSSSAWSQRQRAYATAFELQTIYTPQLFLNGREQVVGGNEREVRAAIRSVSEKPGAELSIEVDPDRSTDEVLRLRVTARMSRNSESDRLLGLLAVFQNDLVTPVERGENARKTLENTRVVRGLHTVLELDGRAGSAATEELELELDRNWPNEDLGLAFFLQDPASMAIEGATAVLLGDL